MGGTVLRNVEGKAGSQERPGHLWESEQKECSTTIRVDGEEGWNSEDEVHCTKPE
jgi:hypothetical protein